MSTSPYGEPDYPAAAAYPPPPGYPPPPAPGPYPGYSTYQPGYPTYQPGYPGYPAAPNSRADGIALAALICSILGVFSLPVVLSIVGIILGHQALTKYDAQGSSRTMAITGLVIGYATLALVAILAILLLVLATA